MALFKKNFSVASDEELMQLLAKQEQVAFDELYKRYSKALLNFFHRMLGNDREKAEDFLHDLFLKIIEKPERFDNSKKFNTWFYTLANNMVKNEYRNKQVRETYQENIIAGNNSYVFNLQNIDKSRFDYQLQIELNKLGTENKTIFNLRFAEELSIKQIAGIMCLPEGTVKSRLFYMIKHLSKALSAYKPI